MKTLGYYNGKFDEVENMSIPMNDRVCYFGDGVYDATCSRNYKIFALDEHIDRIYNSAALLKIEVGQTKQEMKDILQEMVNKMDTGENFVYWQLTRGGTGIRNHVFPTDGSKANLWIMIFHKEIADLNKKLLPITMEDTRFLHCNIKTLNLIPAVMTSENAKQHNCAEAVLHRGGRVTECSHSNISILRDGIFVTAPTDHLILPGIARAHRIKACKKLGIGVDETPFTVEEMMNADEVIMSSSSQLGLAVGEIDGKKVGGKATELLHALQNEVLREFMEETKA